LASRVFVLLQQRGIRKARDAHVKTAREVPRYPVPDVE
jgi:hypothetical protein